MGPYNPLFRTPDIGVCFVHTQNSHRCLAIKIGHGDPRSSLAVSNSQSNCSKRSYWALPRTFIVSHHSGSSSVIAGECDSCIQPLWWIDGGSLYPAWKKSTDSSQIYRYKNTKFMKEWTWMLYFGTDSRYILHASGPYYGWFLCQIWINSTNSYSRYWNKHITFVVNYCTKNKNKINPLYSAISQQA